MSSTRSTPRGNVLVRRFSTRPKSYVGEADDNETTYSGEFTSSIPDSDETSIGNGDPTGADARLLDIDEAQQQILGYDQFANKLLLPDETTLMIRKFEKAEDIAFGVTYQLGKPITGLHEDTFEPQVGIVLLPGADLPEVNRLEGVGMVNAGPDQKDAQWRVNTAGEMYACPRLVLFRLLIASQAQQYHRDPRYETHLQRFYCSSRPGFTDSSARTPRQEVSLVQ